MIGPRRDPVGMSSLSSEISRSSDASYSAPAATPTPLVVAATPTPLVSASACLPKPERTGVRPCLVSIPGVPLRDMLPTKGSKPAISIYARMHHSGSSGPTEELRGLRTPKVRRGPPKNDVTPMKASRDELPPSDDETPSKVRRTWLPRDEAPNAALEKLFEDAGECE